MAPGRIGFVSYPFASPHRSQIEGERMNADKAHEIVMTQYGRTGHYALVEVADFIREQAAKIADLERLCLKAADELRGEHIDRASFQPTGIINSYEYFRKRPFKLARLPGLCESQE